MATDNIERVTLGHIFLDKNSSRNKLVIVENLLSYCKRCAEQGNDSCVITNPSKVIVCNLIQAQH